MTVIAPRAATRTSTTRTVHARPLAGGLTALWLGGFAVVHGYWAFGGRGGVDASAPPIDTRPVFLAYDVLAGLLLLAGAALALAVAGGRLPARSAPRVRSVLAVAAVLLAVRGVVGVGQDLLASWTGASAGVGAVYDAWFVVAAVGVGVLWARVRG